jgi:hypothetical protein
VLKLTSDLHRPPLTSAQLLNLDAA